MTSRRRRGHCAIRKNHPRTGQPDSFGLAHPSGSVSVPQRLRAGPALRTTEQTGRGSCLSCRYLSLSPPKCFFFSLRQVLGIHVRNMYRYSCFARCASVVEMVGLGSDQVPRAALAVEVRHQCIKRVHISRRTEPPIGLPNQPPPGTYIGDTAWERYIQHHSRLEEAALRVSFR